MRPPLGDHVVRNADMPGDSTIGEAVRIRMQQCRLHGALLVLIGAAKSVRAVRAEAIPLRFIDRSLANFALDLFVTGGVGCLHAVEAVGQPVVCAIVEDRHRRELGSGGHGFGVVLDRFKIEGGPGLCTTVETDSVDQDGLALTHRAPPTFAGAKPASIKAARISPIH